MSIDFTYSDIAKMIDHSLLNPALTVPELEAGCQLALRYDVASVCILPYYAARCAQLLAGSTVQPSTTIGFPHGGHTTAVKLAEVEAGAPRRRHRTRHGHQHQPGAQRTVGLRRARDSRAHRSHACRRREDQGDLRERLPRRRGQDPAVRDLRRASAWTGSRPPPDTPPAEPPTPTSQLMRRHSPPSVQVKAAGGVRTLDALLEVRALGVTRVGRHPHRRDARRVPPTPRTCPQSRTRNRHACRLLMQRERQHEPAQPGVPPLRLVLRDENE